jgi:SrtB family sortase
MKNKLYYLGLIFFLTVFIVCGAVLFRYWLDGRRNALAVREWTQWVDGVISGQPAEEIPLTELFARLQAQNPDTVAWLAVADSPVRYPVVQAADNEYYLKTGFDRRRNSHGAIFLDSRNDGFNDFNTIVYGHNMQDNTMFGALVDWGPGLVRERAPIYVVTASGVQVWTVFSARMLEVEKELSLYKLRYDEEELRVLNGSLTAGEPKLTGGSQLLTLSTCRDCGGEDFRYIVQAYRQPEETPPA